MNGNREDTRPKREVLGWDDLFKEVPLPSGKELTTTRIGYHLAIILLIYLGGVTGILLLDMLIHVPSMPDISGLTKEVHENYKLMSDIAIDRTLRLFDQLVHKSFLPVLTAVLGYIFGVRGTEKGDS